MELPPYETVAAIIQCHRDRLGLEQIDQIETALLGQGEANLNVLVTVNQAHRRSCSSRPPCGMVTACPPSLKRDHRWRV